MKALENVSETLWLPLFGKARESKRDDAFFKDPKAIEIAEKACELIPDLSKWWVQLSRETQALMIWRSEALDRYVSGFISRNPNGTVVNLGAGLCTRFSRLDNGKITWVEFDLPDVKDVWLFFNKESHRHQYSTQSLFESEWIETINLNSSGPVMFIAEGLLMYFSKEEVAGLLKKLSTEFPNSELAAEIYSKIALKRPHPDVKKTSAARFKSPWGVLTGKEFESWNVGVTHLEDDYLGKHKKAMSRMPNFNQFIAKLPRLNKIGKIVHLKFNND
jgi:O-methyltransferase involved in polyketide biosynthesis